MPLFLCTNWFSTFLQGLSGVCFCIFAGVGLFLRKKYLPSGELNSSGRWYPQFYSLITVSSFMPIAARTEEIFSPGFKYFLLIWIPGYILMAGLVLSMGYEQSFLWLNSFRIPGADLPMQILSWMGNGGTAGFICWLALRKKESSVLIFCLLSLLLTGLISQLLKHQVFPEWHRPLQVFEGREQIHFFTHQSFRFNSFPSGHSTTAGAMGIILALCWCRTFFQAAGLAIFTLLIGFSRVYIGVHFPGDVIAGWLLGSVVSLLLFVFLKPRLSIRSEKAEKILQIVMTVLAIVLLAWDIYKFPLL